MRTLLAALLFLLAPMCASAGPSPGRRDNAPDGWVAMSLSIQDNMVGYVEIQNEETGERLKVYGKGKNFAWDKFDFTSQGPTVDPSIVWSGKGMDLWWAGGRYRQTVVVRKLPVGKYRIDELYIARPTCGAGMFVINCYKESSENAEFSIESGSVTYIGQFEWTGVKRIDSRTGPIEWWYLSVTDQIARDQSVVRTQSGSGQPVKLQIADVGAGHDWLTATPLASTVRNVFTSDGAAASPTDNDLQLDALIQMHRCNAAWTFAYQNMGADALRRAADCK